jgi:hypothetical protein
VKYKNIRSAAHNFADSFASSLNYDAEDYIMSHLARRALNAGYREFTVDLLSGRMSPPAMLSSSAGDNIARRVAVFPDQLRRQNVDPERIRQATMRLLFEDARASDDIGFPGYKEMPFDIWVTIVDDREKEHVGHIRRWWGFHPTKAEIGAPTIWQRIVRRITGGA